MANGVWRNADGHKRVRVTVPVPGGTTESVKSRDVCEGKTGIIGRFEYRKGLTEIYTGVAVIGKRACKQTRPPRGGEAYPFNGIKGTLRIGLR